MKNVFKTMRASLSKSDIYSKPEGVSAASAIGYMAQFILILTAIKTIVFCFAFVPLAHELRILAADMVAKYPSDLTLTITNGTLSMNKKDPLIVPNTTTSLARSSHKNFLVIDTSKSLDFKALAAYDTSVFLTRDGYMTVDSAGLIKAQTFRQFPNYTLSKTVLDTYTDKLSVALGSKLWLLTIILALGMLIGGYVVSFIFAFFWSLVGTLGTLIITKTKGHSLSFPQLYGLSMYAYTGAIIFGLVNIFIGLPGWVGALVFLAILGGFVSKK